MKTGRRETALSRGAPWDQQSELGEDFGFKRPQKVIFGEVTFYMVFTGPSGLQGVQKDTTGTSYEDTRGL